MQLSTTRWRQTLDLEKEFLRRGEAISWRKIRDAFHLPQGQSRNLLFALNNKHIIKAQGTTNQTMSGEKVLIIADVHIPYQDDSAVAACLAYADQYQPDTIILNGDVIDFYQVSTFTKSPKNKSVFQEIKETKKFLENLRLRFPNAKIIYKTGNHEDRMQRYIYQNASEISDLIDDLIPRKLDLDRLNIKYEIDYFSYGKLWVLHGHEKPGGSYNPEYICNVMWKYVHDHFIVGHFHRNQQKNFKNIGGDVFWTGACGYLAGNMDYAALNAWSQGFVTAEFNGDGFFKAQIHSIMNGEVY